MEQSKKIQRSELYEQIYKAVSKIPRKDVDEDAADAQVVATELEELFLKLLPIQNVSNMFVADDMLGFAEHCRLTGKQCTYDELDKWKQ